MDINRKELINNKKQLAIIKYTMQKRIISKITYSAPKFLLAMGLLCSSAAVFAQKSTSASPYSKFGIGQMREDLLPQNRAMGGLSSGIRYISGVNTLNPGNPASYSAFHHTIFDAGLYGNFTQLEKGSAKDNTADFAFSHITVGIPLGKAGGVSFGLLPFSEVGYSSNSTHVLDTLNYKKTFTGEGGISKAYLGYGLNITKNISIGANVSYLFGSLKDYSAIEFPTSFSGYNTRLEDHREISGVAVDYGMQYYKQLGKKTSLTIGYSGSLNNQINDRSSQIISRITPSIDSENQNIALDTTSFSSSSPRKIQLPLKHNVGITLAKANNWLVGVEFKYADWSGFKVREGEDNLDKSIGGSIGGQYTPKPNSPLYRNIIDYRVGLRYNQSQYKINTNRINDMALSFGVGLPLSSSAFSGSFSKINITAEVGQMGTLDNKLIRERYVNLHVGFTLNDRWFQRRKYD